MQPEALIEACILYNKKYPNKNYQEGDYLLVETVDGYKDVYVKSTIDGTLFIEAVKKSTDDEIIGIDIKFVKSNFFHIPTFETLIKNLLEIGYKIELNKDKKLLYKDNVLVFEGKFLNKLEMMELIIKHE